MDAATRPGARLREIELKLALSPQDAPALAAHPLLEARGEGPPETRDLRSVYYDTADGVLADAGYVLRVRTGSGRIVQTVKAAGAASLMPERLEAEAELPGETPDLRFVPDPALRAELTERIGARDLAPRYETEIRRTEWTLRSGGAMLSVALDQGVIRTLRGRARSALVNELEIELREGPPAEVWRLARALAETVPLRPRATAKSARGERLAAGGPMRAVKAGRIDLTESATLDDAIACVLAHCLTHIAANEPAVTEARKPEGVHQLRVALRRLRAALAVIRRFVRGDALKRLGQEAKALAAALGAARDMDVFCAAMLPPVLEAAPGEPGLPDLVRAATGARRRAWAALKPALSPQTLTPFLLDLALVVEERRWTSRQGEDAIRLSDPPRRAAERALDRRLAEVETLGADLEALSSERRHDLRIALKKLRYAGEFFESLFPRKAAARYLAALAELQDVFGAMNDAATVAATLQALVPPDAPPALHRAAGLVQGFHAARMTADWKAARKRWKSFAAEKPFWR